MQTLYSVIDCITQSKNITLEQLEQILQSKDSPAIDYLYSKAREIAQQIYGKNIYIRGLIEFTNYCKNDCFYCGIRHGNVKAVRYRLTQEVREALDISESTLYPVLRRLQKEGYLHAYDEPYQGRNRRYYQITELGHQKYEEFLKEWDVYKKKVDHILVGGVEHE